MKIDLSGKTVVVTGASGELGRVITRTLAKCGANIVIHYFHSREAAQVLLEEIQNLGVAAITVRADITEYDSILNMRDIISNQMAYPDIVINNAVIQYQWTSVLEQPVQDYESQFKSCVMQNVLMAKAFIPAMIEKKYGRIIAVNTECAMQNFVNQSAYVAGKRGMDGVLRVLAREVGEHQITVNQVAPGWTISDRERNAGIIRHEEYEKNIPLKRRGQDQEVANVIAFLASDLASYITGAYIPVCGGNVMPGI
ncbi:MAG: SDR family oxidoreductase [Clostridia bacterium]|nr:SDR family oxidoreductase [Clostridia bacterium]